MNLPALLHEFPLDSKRLQQRLFRAPKGADVPIEVSDVPESPCQILQVVSPPIFSGSPIAHERGLKGDTRFFESLGVPVDESQPVLYVGKFDEVPGAVSASFH